MGSLSLVHWIIILGIVLLLFGAGRLPHVMGDFAKGIKAFRAGLKDEEPKAAGDQPGPSSIAQGVPNPSANQTVSGDRKAG